MNRRGFLASLLAAAGLSRWVPSPDVEELDHGLSMGLEEFRKVFIDPSVRQMCNRLDAHALEHLSRVYLGSLLGKERKFDPRRLPT